MIYALHRMAFSQKYKITSTWKNGTLKPKFGKDNGMFGK